MSRGKNANIPFNFYILDFEGEKTPGQDAVFIDQEIFTLYTFYFLQHWEKISNLPFSDSFHLISNTLLKHRSSKIMPTKHQLDWNNICENDSVTVTSRLYRFTVRSQLEFAPQRDLTVLDLLSLRTRSRLGLVRPSRERSDDDGEHEFLISR